MKIILSLLISLSSVEAAASYYPGHEILQPCSKRELLRNRDDAPSITPMLTCHKIKSKKLRRIESLNPIGAGFNYGAVKQGDFCLAVLEDHRQYSEVFFSGSLSYRLNKNKIRKDIEASAEFVPSTYNIFRQSVKLAAGEVRPDRENARIYQEKDLGSFIDIRIDRNNFDTQVHLRDRKENLDLQLELECERY